MFDISKEENDDILRDAGMKPSQQQVRYVYLLAGKLGYDSSYVHDTLRPSHITKDAVSDLIEDLNNQLTQMEQIKEDDRRSRFGKKEEMLRRFDMSLNNKGDEVF